MSRLTKVAVLTLLVGMTALAAFTRYVDLLVQALREEELREQAALQTLNELGRSVRATTAEVDALVEKRAALDRESADAERNLAELREASRRSACRRARDFYEKALGEALKGDEIAVSVQFEYAVKYDQAKDFSGCYGSPVCGRMLDAYRDATETVLELLPGSVLAACKSYDESCTRLITRRREALPQAMREVVEQRDRARQAAEQCLG